MRDSVRSNSSVACNAEMLKYLREQRGWTQEELAHRAECSDRLVRKAESGQPVQRQSIASFAAALDSAEHPVHPDDLTSDPVALAKKYTEALHVHQANLVDAIRHFLDDEVVFRISGDPTVVPFAGEHRGVEAIDRGFKLFFSILELPENHDFTKHHRYIAQGTDVVIWGESYLHPKGQPMAKPMSISNLLRFRRGKLYHFEDNYDTHWAAQVLA